MTDLKQFQLIDLFAREDYIKLPNSLRFDKSIKEEGKLFRLLVGSVQIKNNISEEIVDQPINYSILGKKTNVRFSKKLFHEFINPGYGIEKIDEYLKSSNPNNIPLFKDLLNEYCFYFENSAKGIHTLSFLYIYRVLERISYTFPMLYASKATDYVGTFNKLQTYFKGSNSELKFLNLFINEFFDEEFLEARVKIDITGYNEDVKEKYYKVIRKLCTQNDPNIDIVSCTEFSEITITNKDIINLMIHLRNRYFHFASGGQRNIDSSELIEPNQFFSLLNEHFMNWLSFTYFELIKKQV